MPTFPENVRYRSRQIGNVGVFYREAGPADVPVVLLLHGFPTASHIFREKDPLRCRLRCKHGAEPLVRTAVRTLRRDVMLTVVLAARANFLDCQSLPFLRRSVAASFPRSA